MRTYYMSTPYWFVEDVYGPAGRPKIEADLARYAKGMLLDCLVHDDDLPFLVEKLKHQQAEIRKENLRLKPCEIRLSETFYSSGTEKIRWIYVGASHIALRKCRATLERTKPFIIQTS